jgi:hypothetical protein
MAPLPGASVSGGTGASPCAAQDRPLHALLGLPARRIQSGVTLGIPETIPALLDAVAEAMRRPYHRVKLKILKARMWNGCAPCAAPGHSWHGWPTPMATAGSSTQRSGAHSMPSS